MKDYIDIQERPSWGSNVAIVFNIYLLCLVPTVLVPYLLKVDPATALFIEWYRYITVVCL